MTNAEIFEFVAGGVVLAPFFLLLLAAFAGR